MFKDALATLARLMTRQRIVPKDGTDAKEPRVRRTIESARATRVEVEALKRQIDTIAHEHGLSIRRQDG